MSARTPMTLVDLAREHLAMLEGGEVTVVRAEVERFVRWAGGDRAIGQLTANEVANYADTLTGTMADAARRGEAVKRFLAYAKKAGYTTTNLGVHLRLKKGSKKTVSAPAPASIEMTEQDKAALVDELESLKAQRPRIVDDIRRAMADKDFRENAPLDAAKQQQAYVEGRIRSLEVTLDRAVIVEAAPAPGGDAIELGSTVQLRNRATDKAVSYTLVRPSEADATQGRISYQSPVGQALLQRRAGDEVDVDVPSGTVRFRIERVET